MLSAVAPQLKGNGHLATKQRPQPGLKNPNWLRWIRPLPLRYSHPPQLGHNFVLLLVRKRTGFVYWCVSVTIRTQGSGCRGLGKGACLFETSNTCRLGIFSQGPATLRCLVTLTPSDIARPGYIYINIYGPVFPIQ